jgi:hypothetical protein
MREVTVCLFGICVAATLGSEASAANPTVTVEYQADAGTFNGLQYVFIEGTMSGTVTRADNTTGTYKVPLVMFYPRSGGNSVGIVELTNSGFHLFERSDTGELLACGRGDEFEECQNHNYRVFEKLLTNFAIIAGESYLWRQGYAYMGLQWNKMVTDQMGDNPPDGLVRRRNAYGTIERSSDTIEITLDGARWMRNPSAFTGGAPAVAAQGHIIGYGYSNGAFVYKTILNANGNKEANGSLIYDGVFAYATGAICWEFLDDAPWFGTFQICPGPPVTDGAKVLSVDTQTDIEVLGGAFARDFALGTDDAEPNFARWEVAGISHVAARMLDQTYKGTDRQNTADPFPVQRAAFYHLTRWIKQDIAPPATVHINGSVDDEGNWTTELDADGNAIGGLRLPHIQVPTGTYGGVDFDMLPTYWLNALGGTYVRFSDAELASRYPTAQAYRDAYNAAAADALAKGYIIQEDYERFTRAPADIPEPPDEEEPPPPMGDAGCCDSGTRNSAPGAILLSTFVMLVGLRRRRPTASTAAKTTALLVLLVVGLVGCGDDGTTPGVCVGHTCPDPTIDMPEGGEVRLELVYWENRAPELRMHAWFAGSQNPQTRPWPRHPRDWGIQDGPDLCTDLRTGIYFPSGIPTARTYLDAGDNVAFVGSGNDVVLDKKTNTRDLVFDVPHDIVYMGDPNPAVVTPGTTYDFRIAGGPGLPAQTVTDAIHLPDDTTVTFPDMSNHLVFPRNKDFRFFWDTKSTDPYDFAFIAFADLYGAVGFCIGPQSGYMTIPQAFIKAMPQSGVIQHGLVNHKAIERADGRKFDFLGINCRQTTYVLDNGL